MIIPVGFQVLLLALTGLVDERARHAITFLQAENQVLREMLRARGQRRLSFTDQQRRRLAEAGRRLSRKWLEQISPLVHPDTLLRWYRELVAAKYTSGACGRGGVSAQLVTLVIKLARENRGWGYTRIVGELRKLGREISRSTVARILEREGLTPAPKRKQGLSWKEFIARHSGVVAATDFFAVEVVTPVGLVRYMVLFAIKIGTRQVELCGIAPDPGELWMSNMARKLADAIDGFLLGMKYLVHDRDALYSRAFRRVVAGIDVKCLRLPAKSPNLNAHAERFVLSIRSECLDHVIPLGEAHLRLLVSEYIEHYNRERPHQGLGNVLVLPRAGPVPTEGPIRCSSRIGGLLKSYERRAA